MTHRDPSLDNLLDLNGQVLVIDETGCWVKFVVRQVPASDSKPHGLDHSLTLHGLDGDRLVGLDNAHRVKGRARGAGHGHQHRLLTVRPYEETEAGALVAAFWKEVESVMREKGVST